jgi:OmpA-OmpF porin, OOP family
MAPTLVHTVKTYFTSDFTQQAANVLNEHESRISKALTALIPATLMGILNMAASGNEGSQNIFERAKEEAANFRISHDINKLITDTKKDTLASDIFGNDQSLVKDSIAKFAAIEISSVAMLIRLVIPGILGLLGKHDGRKELSASGLSGFLASERNDIIYAMPSALTSLADALNYNYSNSSASFKALNNKVEVPGKMDAASKNNKAQIKWVIGVAIVLIVLALLWYFS